jgi:hypothetical protein
MIWTEGEKIYESPTLSRAKENGAPVGRSTKTGIYPGAISENE